MSNSYLLQGERMDLTLGGFTIPAASLQLFDSAVIIILVPLMDRLVFPLLDRCNLRPSLLKKIGKKIQGLTISTLDGNLLALGYKKLQVALYCWPIVRSTCVISDSHSASHHIKNDN